MVKRIQIGCWARRRSRVTDAQLVEMVKLYLEDGLSFRSLEEQVLGIVSPDRGGGFIAKTALNEIGVRYKPFDRRGNAVGIVVKGVLQRMPLVQLRDIARAHQQTSFLETLDIVYGPDKE